MMDRDGLLQFQRRFAASLLKPLAAGIDAAVVPFGHQVHRRNVLASLVSAIETTFAVTRALVGAEFFAAMAAHFVTAYPPTRGCLCSYGARFPAFVERYGPAAAVPYLPDMARLEWARVRAAGLPDGPGLDLRTLSTQPADVLAGLVKVRVKNVDGMPTIVRLVDNDRLTLQPRDSKNSVRCNHSSISSELTYVSAMDTFHTD